MIMNRLATIVALEPIPVHVHVKRILWFKYQIVNMYGHQIPSFDLNPMLAFVNAWNTGHYRQEIRPTWGSTQSGQSLYCLNILSMGHGRSRSFY